MKNIQLTALLFMIAVASKAQISANPSLISSVIPSTSRNVGIGTNSPLGGLHMLTGGGRNSNATFILERSDLPISNQRNKLTIGISSNMFTSPTVLPAGSCAFTLSNPYSVSDMAFSTNQNAPQLIIKQNGNVGIGTINPLQKFDVQNGAVRIGNVTTPVGYKLYVETGILTEKIKVALKTSVEWADYVFEKDYKLKSLDEVEKFAKANKHLPGVPSAEEIVKNGGIDVNEMFAKQMEKIEELTLYLIEMKKELVEMQKENNELKISISNFNK
jgi:hypothetical protein